MAGGGTSRRFNPLSFGDYKVVRVIASGGMGTVYEVEHVGTAIRYAAKTLLKADEPKARARFRREAELVARCDHRHIVRIHSLGETKDGILYLILELVAGEGLDALLAREGPFAPARAASLARKVAEALGHVHARGIVHRDVKPSNILIEPSGEPRLTDFGLSIARDVERLSKSGQFFGTPSYCSPEQALTQATTAASDVFALGCILFRLLAGRLPIEAHDLQSHIARLVSEVPLDDVRSFAPSVPKPLAAIVARTLEKDPGRRYRDGDDLARDLARFEAGERLSATTLQLRPRSRRRLAVAGVALVSAVALVGGPALQRTSRARAHLHVSSLALDEARRALDRGRADPHGADPFAAARESARVAVVEAEAARALGADAAALTSDSVETAIDVALADARLALGRARAEGALAAIASAAGFGALPGEGRLLHARALLATGRLEEASREAEAAASTPLPDPSRADAFEIAGDSQRALEHPDRALALYEKALRVKPADLALVAKQGGAAALAGRTDVARRALAAALPADLAKLSDPALVARVAPIAPALYRRALDDPARRLRDLDLAFRLAPPPPSMRAEVAATIPALHVEGERALNELLLQRTVTVSDVTHQLVRATLRVTARCRVTSPEVTRWNTGLYAILRICRVVDAPSVPLLSADLVQDNPDDPALHAINSYIRTRAGIPIQETFEEYRTAVLACAASNGPGDDASSLARLVLLSAPVGWESRPCEPALLDALFVLARRSDDLNGWRQVGARAVRTDALALYEEALAALTRHLADAGTEDVELVGQDVAFWLWALYPDMKNALAHARPILEGGLCPSAAPLVARLLVWWGLTGDEPPVPAVRVGRLVAAGQFDEAVALADSLARSSHLPGGRRGLLVPALGGAKAWRAVLDMAPEGLASDPPDVIGMIALARLATGDLVGARALCRGSKRAFSTITLMRCTTALDVLDRGLGACDRGELDAAMRAAEELESGFHELSAVARSLGGRIELARGDLAAAAHFFREAAQRSHGVRAGDFLPRSAPRVALRAARVVSGREACFEAIGPAGTSFTLRDVTPGFVVEPRDGVLPAVITVRAGDAAGSVQPFAFTLVPARGAAVPASGALFQGTWRVELLGVPEDAAKSDAWRTLPARDELTTPELAFGWGDSSPTARALAPHFAVRAACELEVAAARYTFEAAASGPLRVLVDGAVVLAESEAHDEPRTATIELAAGKHRVQVEFLHGTGDAHLRCHLGPAR